MPDERNEGTGQRSSANPPRRPRQPDSPRSRRSMEASGGISVSDMVARHTGQRPVFAPPAPEAPRPAAPRRAEVPEPPPRQQRQSGAHPVPGVRQPRPPRRMPAAGEMPTRAVPPVQPPVAPAAPVKPPVAPAQVKPPQRRPEPDATQVAQPVRRPRRPAAPRPPVETLMTDELDTIDEPTRQRRKIDHTLARFSAAHDEMEAEENRKRERRERLAARPVALFEQTRTALQRVVAPSASSEPGEKAETAEKAEEKPAQTRLQEKKVRKTERSVLVGRITAIALAAIVFLGTGAAWGAKEWFDQKFKEVSALDENSADIQNAAGQTGDENFLLVGSDSRDGASAEDGVGTANGTPGARSDSVMIAHIPADRQRVVVVSFPRDLEIARPECNRFDAATSQYSNEKSPAQKIAKLNTAYAVGGPQCVTKVIQQITGMKMTHFVGIDFNGFKDMVDAVQGVTVHTDIPIDDSVLGMVIPEAGDHSISGDQALNFVRARHVKDDVTSDYGRIKRQQEFIGALLKKVMSKDVMLNAGKLTGFVTAFAKATFGDNIGVDQMLTLAQSMKGVDPSKVNFMTVPTTGNANSRGNEVLVQAKASAVFKSLIENAPLPDPNKPVEEAAPPSAPAKSTSGGKKSATTG